METHFLSTRRGPGGFTRLFLGLLFVSSLLLQRNAQAQCLNYQTPGLYTYTVPAGGPFTIRITTKGGDGASSKGGSGATVIGSFVVQSGDQLTTIVGEAGRTYSDQGGGGGGTAVILNRGGTRSLLAAAGGGGGANPFYNLLGGGGQGTGYSGGGAGGDGNSGSDSGGGGGGGGLDAAGAAGTVSRPGQGGGQASLTAISPGGGGNANLYDGGSGFGGGGSSSGNSSGGGGGGGGYGGGRGGDARGNSNTTSQGGYSYLSPLATTTTITPGVTASGQQQNGFATLVYPNNTATASITSSNTTLCAGQSTNITGTINASGTWTITLSDGTTKTGTGSVFSILVTPPTNITYTIQCLSDANGVAQSGNISGSTVVTANSSLGITHQPASGSSVCVGTTVTASVSTTGTATGYQWYRNGGLVSGQTSATLTLSNVATVQSGSYRAVVTSSCNSVTSTAFTLTVNPSPTVSITPSATAVCAGQNATLQATPGLTSYRWSSGQTTASISATATGIYSVTATSSGSCSATASASVTVNPPPTVSITPSATGICTGQSATLAATPGLASYRWNTGQTTATISVTATAIYSLTVTNASGCSATASATVTASPPPAVSISPSATAVCAGQSATFSATPGLSTYRWTTPNGGPTLTTASITVSVAGTYALTVTNASGCIATTSASLTVNPLPTASLGNDGPLTCTKTSVTLSATGGNTAEALSYRFSAGASQIGNGPTATVSQQGIYSVTVVTASACAAVASTSVTSNTALATPTLLTQTGQAYPGGQSAVSVDLNTGTVTLLADGCAGTIQWTGSNNTAGTGSPINVPTSQPGTFIYQARCQLGSCTSPPATVTVTVSGRLTVLHRDVDNYADNNAIQPVLIVQNQGGGALPLSAITLRYYLTVENFMPLTNLFINYAQVGAANVQSRYVPLDQPRQGAFGYVEYSFTEGAGQLAAGQDSGPIQGYIAKSDYGGLNELDDYSYATERDRLLANPRITAYYNGVLVWGQEPPLLTPQRALRVFTESKNGPSATAITTNLDLRNEGNLPVNYADLRIRYYFTADNQQGLTFYSDFMYEGALQGQLVSLNPPLANADTYLEFRPTFTGQLMPLSHLGVLRYSIYSPQGARLDQTNDYSYQEQPADLSPNSHVVVYVGNERVWGQEPGTNARLAAAEPGTVLGVQVLGNPVQGQTLTVQVQGAANQPLRLQLTDGTGRVVGEQSLDRAEAVERLTLRVGSASAGLLLLRVSTPSQSQTVKVLKVD